MRGLSTWCLGTKELALSFGACEHTLIGSFCGMRRGMWFPLVLQFACVAPSPVTSPPVVQQRSLVEIQTEILPAVALLYGQDEAGRLHYGTGLLLEEEGQILTNWHVVKPHEETFILFHDPERETYTALDGGVSRLIRELNTGAMRAEVLKTDVINDLALLELVEAPATWSSPLTLRDTPAMSGESVWSVGHPAGNVWSFTRGVVSAVHRGAVQHDASVNGGNSGGPLLDMQGRVIGINTFKLLESGGRVIDGISYARPISLAAPLYDEDAVFEMDLSSPEASMRSFWMAVELGRKEAIEAVSFESGFELFREGWLEIKRIWVEEDLPGLIAGFVERYDLPEGSFPSAEALGPSVLLFHTAGANAPEFREDFMTWSRTEAVSLIQGQSENSLAWESQLDEQSEYLRGQALEDLREAIENIEPGLVEAYAELPWAWELACGLTADPENPQRLTELLKLGLSVNAVRMVEGGDVAWVMTSGVDTAGNPFQCSNFLRKQDEVWLQDNHLKESELATLPPDFPPVPPSFEAKMADYVDKMQHALRDLETTSFLIGVEQGIKDSQQGTESQ